MWFEFFIQLMVYIAFILLTQRQSPGYGVATAIVNDVNRPVEEVNFYFMYNTEAQGNVMNAAIVRTATAVEPASHLP